MALSAPSFSGYEQENKLVSVKLRRVALVLALVGLLAETFILAAPYWRNTSTWGSAQLVSNIWVFEGLFLFCQQWIGTPGNNQCYQLPMYGNSMSGYMGGNTWFLTEGVYSKYSHFLRYGLGC